MLLVLWPPQGNTSSFSFTTCPTDRPWISRQMGPALPFRRGRVISESAIKAKTCARSHLNIEKGSFEPQPHWIHAFRWMLYPESAQRSLVFRSSCPNHARLLHSRTPSTPIPILACLPLSPLYSESQTGHQPPSLFPHFHSLHGHRRGRRPPAFPIFL